MEKAARNIQGAFASRLVVLGLSIITAFFYARFLSPTELALIAWVSVLSSIEAMITGFGSSAFLLRSFPKAKSSGEISLALSYARTYIIISGVSTLLFCFLVWSFSEAVFQVIFRASDTSTIRSIVVSCVLFSGLGRTVSFLGQSEAKFIPLGVIASIKSVAQNILVIGLYFMLGRKGLILGISIVEIISFIVMLIMFRSSIFVSAQMYPIAQILKESIGFYFEGYIRYLANYSDKLLVSMFFGPASLGYYSMAKNLAFKIAAIRDTMVSVMVPYLARASTDTNGSVDKIINKTIAAFSITILPISLVFAGACYWILNVFGGDNYLDSTFSAILLCLFMPISAYQVIYGQALYVCGKQTDRLIVLVIQSVAMLVSLFLMASVYSNFNTIALSRLFGVVISFFFAKKMFKRYGQGYHDWGIFIKAIASVAIGSIVIIAGYILYYDIFIMPLFLLAGAAIIVFVFVNITERSSIISLFDGSFDIVLRIAERSYDMFRVRKYS